MGLGNEISHTVLYIVFSNTYIILSCCGGSGYEWNLQDTCCQCNLAAVTEIVDEDDGAEVLYSNWHAQVCLFSHGFFLMIFGCLGFSDAFLRGS